MDICALRVMNPQTSDPSPNKVVSKVENVDPKVPKQAETKGDGVIDPQNYNCNQNFN